MWSLLTTSDHEIMCTDARTTSACSFYFYLNILSNHRNKKKINKKFRVNVETFCDVFKKVFRNSSEIIYYLVHQDESFIISNDLNALLWTVQREIPSWSRFFRTDVCKLEGFGVHILLCGCSLTSVPHVLIFPHLCKLPASFCVPLFLTESPLITQRTQLQLYDLIVFFFFTLAMFLRPPATEAG